jgi:hypothetical protein
VVGRNHYQFTLNELFCTSLGAESPTGEVSTIVVPVVDIELDSPVTLRSISAADVAIYTYDTTGSLAAAIHLPDFTTVTGRRITPGFSGRVASRSGTRLASCGLTP